MYAGYVDDRLLFSAGMAGHEISAGTLHKEIGKCDSATIKLPPSNLMRDTPIKRASIIKICKDGVTVFKGCVADTSMDFAGNKTYNIDGAMMWMKDICKPPFTMTEETMLYYATAIITQYNDVCRATKQIKLGTVDDTLPTLAVEQTEYKSMLSLLQDAAQAIGGTLCIRYDGDDIFLDVIKAYDHRCAQQIEISKNLLDLTDQIDSADLITRVYPLGKGGLTIASVNNNSTCLINADAEGLYGRIDGTLRVDTDDADALKAQAAAYLAQYCGLSHGIRVTAADLSAVDFKLESYHIGDSVRVVSPPHGIDTIMQVTSMDTSLVSEKDTMVLGWSNRTLTGAVASGGGGSSSGTTPSGSGGTIDVDDALSLDSTNPVQNKVITAALAGKASTATATQSAAGLMSAADKTKLDGVEAGANKTVVDAALDASSTNPVQNKAVKAALDKKADKTALDTKADTTVATASANGLMSAADKEKLDSMYDIVATSTDGETFDITPAQLHEKLKGVPTTCAIKVADTIIPLYRVQFPGDGSTTYVFQITKDNGWNPTTRLSYTASAGGTSLGTKWIKSEYDFLAITPGLLKFTGAAEAQFRGREDVTIDIPTGEGSVRYDETQKLTSDQKFRACQNIGAVSQKHAFIDGAVMLQAIGHDDGVSVVNITPSEKSNGYTLALDAGPENVPVRVSGIETPTDAQTDCATNVAYVKAKIAEVAASGGVDVDNALSATSTNPVQNKVITSALTGKAGTAVATTSANGLMSKADKTKLDGIAAGANKITIDSTMSGSSVNPVQNKVIKQYVDDKVAADGSNITVDAALSSTSANPVQNKAVKAAIDAKADKTALDAKVDKTALDAKMDKSGGTFTGNVYGKYFCGTWLQSTAASDLGRTPGKIAVLDDSGWMYYRTPSELFADLGITNAIKSCVDTAIIAAINSSY